MRNPQRGAGKQRPRPRRRGPGRGGGARVGPCPRGPRGARDAAPRRGHPSREESGLQSVEIRDYNHEKQKKLEVEPLLYL